MPLDGSLLIVEGPCLAGTVGSSSFFAMRKPSGRGDYQWLKAMASTDSYLSAGKTLNPDSLGCVSNPKPPPNQIMHA